MKKLDKKNIISRRIQSDQNKALNLFGQKALDSMGLPGLFKYGRGAKVYDYDGKEYTDYFLNDGSLILGHSHRNVVLNIKKTAERGTGFGSYSREAVWLASEIQNRFSYVEKISFLSSSQDMLNALQSSKKSHIITFQSEFLNNNPSYIQLPYNDSNKLIDVFTKDHDKISGIIMPMAVLQDKLILGDKDFIKLARDLTLKYSSFLVFDETLTGFRTSNLARHLELSINPDAIFLDGIISAGFPFCVLASTKKFVYNIENLSIMQSAQLTNPIILRASLMTIRSLNKDYLNSLTKQTIDWQERINNAFASRNMLCKVVHYGNMFYLELKDDFCYTNFSNHMLENKILWSRSNPRKFFLTKMHCNKDLDKLIEVVLKAVLKEK